MTFPTLSSLTPYFLCTILFILLIEQISYLKKKRFIPGPTFVVPFLGNAVPLVRNPTKFWDLQSSTAKSSPLGICSNYLVGKFIIFIRDTELSQKIFNNVSPDTFALIGHPFGKKLFGEHNLIYMTGQPHKDLRRRIAPNFSNNALATYTHLQYDIILNHLNKWHQLSSKTTPLPLRLLIRDMNLETSQTVFVGPYLDTDARARFNSDYSYFNVGLMKLPIDLPGSAFRSARVAVSRLASTLSKCAEQSRARMSDPATEPICLIDFWMAETLREAAAAEEAGEAAPANVTDEDMGSYLFDFLFAAQDASSSSLLWAIALLDAHREVLQRVREEVEGVWSPESSEAITAEMLAQMRYTHAVAREVVRYRPPATLVPHVAEREFPLTEEYSVPRGTIVFPSTFESCMQGFTDAGKFDPDRFSEERREDRVFKRNFLAFGAGPHQCVGQRYAMNHLVLFIAMFSSLLEFDRHQTQGCDDIAYVPTICPKDDCTVFLRPRYFPAHGKF